jgi:hypothetical protein
VSTGNANAQQRGPMANERLTAITGAVLFVLLAAEGVTIVDLRPLFDAHVFIGVMLVGPVTVKLGSTGYRFLRYYSGSPSYRQKGPPNPVMRILAPPLIVATITVVGSGIVLLGVRPSDPGPWLFIHKASFVVWFGLTAVHVVVYGWRVPRLIKVDWRQQTAVAARGATARLLINSVGLLGGAVAAALLLPYAQAWLHWITIGVSGG